MEPSPNTTTESPIAEVASSPSTGPAFQSRARPHRGTLCSAQSGGPCHSARPPCIAPKWHLAHTTWFFEQFILKETPGYKLFNEDMAYMFNSYYEHVGKRVLRGDRGT